MSSKLQEVARNVIDIYLSIALLKIACLYIPFYPPNEEVYFPMLNGTLSFLQKYLFLLFSFQFCIIYGTCSQKCSGNS